LRGSTFSARGKFPPKKETFNCGGLAKVRDALCVSVANPKK